MMIRIPEEAGDPATTRLPDCCRVGRSPPSRSTAPTLIWRASSPANWNGRDKGTGRDKTTSLYLDCALGNPGRIAASPHRRFGRPNRPVRRPTSPRDGSGPLLASGRRRSAGDRARTETGRRRIGNRDRMRPVRPSGVARPDRLVTFGAVGRRCRRAGPTGGRGGQRRGSRAGRGSRPRLRKRGRPVARHHGPRFASGLTGSWFFLVARSGRVNERWPRIGPWIAEPGDLQREVTS